MGKGRLWGRALRSKVTATGRWVPKTNSHAVCVGIKLAGKNGDLLKPQRPANPGT
jgi:hypothetical protein